MTDSPVSDAGLGPHSPRLSRKQSSPPQGHGDVRRRIGSIAVVPSILHGRPQVNAPANGRAFAPSETIPNFVKQYYETSTFHHLSSWRLRYQQMTSDLMQGKRRRLTENHGESEEDADEAHSSPPIPASNNPAAPMLDPIPAQTVVFHVDLDCFYVSVAVRDNPALRGRPVAVCPASRFQGTSEIASASYEARKFGIKSRMHIGEARRLCPDLICVPCNYPEYEKVSVQMFEIFTRHTNRVLAVSADEAYLDMSAFPDPRKAAEDLRNDIKTATGCTASIGISHNMLLARVATKKAKPNGVFHIQDGFIDLLAEIEVKDLPGFGPATVDKLKRRGVVRVQQLRALSKDTLQTEFGKKHGEMMWHYARGMDDRVIAVQNHTRKSVGTQISWGVRFQEMPQLERFIHDVAAEVHRRMVEVGAKGKRINLRIKKRAEDAPEPTKLFNPGKHTIVHKSVTLAHATDDAEVIARECLRMYKQSRIALTDFRGVGLSIDQLEGARKEKREKRTRTLDDMLRPKQQFAIPAAAGAAAEREERKKDRKVGGLVDDDERVEGLLVQEEGELSFAHVTSSDSPPTTSLSPEEAAREAELMRDRQPSPDLWSYSPASPVRPMQTTQDIIVVHSSGSSAGTQGSTQALTAGLLDLDDAMPPSQSQLGMQRLSKASITPEEIRNVLVASEQPEYNGTLFLSSGSSSSSPDQQRTAAIQPHAFSRPDRRKKASALSLPAMTTKGRGRGMGQQRSFRQLDLGSFAGRGRGRGARGK